jgi:hypothetical protein
MSPELALFGSGPTDRRRPFTGQKRKSLLNNPRSVDDPERTYAHESFIDGTGLPQIADVLEKGIAFIVARPVEHTGLRSISYVPREKEEHGHADYDG